MILCLCLIGTNLTKKKHDFKKILRYIKISFKFLLKKNISEQKLFIDTKNEKINIQIKKKFLLNENKRYNNIYINKENKNNEKKKKKDLSFKINSVKCRKGKPFRSLMKVKIIILIILSISINFLKMMKLIFSGDFKYFEQKKENNSFNSKNRFLIKFNDYQFSQNILKQKKKNYILQLRAIKKSKQKIQKKIIRIEKVISKKRKLTNLPIILETPLRV